MLHTGLDFASPHAITLPQKTQKPPEKPKNWEIVFIELSDEKFQ